MTKVTANQKDQDSEGNPALEVRSKQGDFPEVGEGELPSFPLVFSNHQENLMRRKKKRMRIKELKIYLLQILRGKN